MASRLDAIVLVAVMLAVSSLRAQGAPAATPPATVMPPATVAPTPAATEAYTYSQNGRRDPFVSLLSTGTEAVRTSKGAGLAGIATSDLILRGVIHSRGGYVALISGPDGKTHRAHVNDAVADGVIRSVTPQGIVVMQEVNDPLSLVKQREVRKGLRNAEDGK